MFVAPKTFLPCSNFICLGGGKISIVLCLRLQSVLGACICSHIAAPLSGAPFSGVSFRQYHRTFLSLAHLLFLELACPVLQLANVKLAKIILQSRLTKWTVRVQMEQHTRHDVSVDITIMTSALTLGLSSSIHSYCFSRFVAAVTWSTFSFASACISCLSLFSIPRHHRINISFMTGASSTEEQAHRGTRRESTKGSPCTYIFCMRRLSTDAF